MSNDDRIAALQRELAEAREVIATNSEDRTTRYYMTLWREERERSDEFERKLRDAIKGIDGSLNELVATTEKRFSALNQALVKINTIRNSIVSLQTINWSEHIYPLVAALDEADFKGLPYPADRAYLGSIIDQVGALRDAMLGCFDMAHSGDYRIGQPAIDEIVGHSEDVGLTLETRQAWFDEAAAREPVPQTPPPTPEEIQLRADTDKLVAMLRAPMDPTEARELSARLRQSFRMPPDDEWRG